MSAKLKIEGKELLLESVHFSLYRNTDEYGRPIGNVTGGRIDFDVNSDKETILMEWMCTPNKKLNGSIEFPDKKIKGQILKTLEFKDAYCVAFSENCYTHNDETSVTINASISAREITMGNAVHKNRWS